MKIDLSSTTVKSMFVSPELAVFELLDETATELWQIFLIQIVHLKNWCDNHFR